MMDDSDGPNYPEPPEDGWRCVSFDPPDGGVATYGNVSIQCPGCEYDWEENAQRVEREVGRALGKPTHTINPGTPDACEVSRDGHGRVPLGERPEWRYKKPLAELLEQAEHHGMLLAEVAEDGTLVMSGNETRLKEGYARVRKWMPDAKVGKVTP